MLNDQQMRFILPLLIAIYGLTACVGSPPIYTPFAAERAGVTWTQSIKTSRELVWEIEFS
jgi:hypothetical protein